MDPEWNALQPVYHQLHDRLVAMIRGGLLRAGDPLPPVRTIASARAVSPLTVLEVYQQLEGERLVEKRRGVGVFINPGAREQLLAAERAAIAARSAA